jgi:hypothetical protein
MYVVLIDYIYIEYIYIYIYIYIYTQTIALYIETLHKIFLSCPLSCSTCIYQNFSRESEDNYLLALGYVEK